MNLRNRVRMKHETNVEVGCEISLSVLLSYNSISDHPVERDLTQDIAFVGAWY